MNTKKLISRLLPFLLVLALLPFQAAQAAPGDTIRVSVDANGAQTAGTYQENSISGDGRYIAFVTPFALVTADTNGLDDIYVRDTQTNTTLLVSVATDGTFGNNVSAHPAMSANGQFIVFQSNATTLTSDGIGGIFVRDLVNNTTIIVSVNNSGTPTWSPSFHPSISADGRYVVFSSWARQNLTENCGSLYDNNEFVYLRDTVANTTTCVSFDSSGNAIGGGSAVISGDGRYVIFGSGIQLWVRDTQTNTSALVSVDSDGNPGNGESTDPASVSSDGRFIAFNSSANNLVPNDTNGWKDTFVHDRDTDTDGIFDEPGAISTYRVSVSSDGFQGTAYSLYPPSISADGRFVAFTSRAKNLVPGIAYDTEELYLRDTLLNATSRISVSSSGVQASGSSQYPSMSADGHFVSFSSGAADLVSGDTNGNTDIFRHEMMVGVPPTILSIMPFSPNTAGTRKFVIEFSEAVNNVDVSDFTLTTTGDIAATVNSVLGPFNNGTQYTVVAAYTTGNGSIRLDVPVTATITDLQGNNVSNLPYTSGITYGIDQTPPTASSITRADSNPTNASSVSFTVTFSESVTGVDSGDFTLSTSGVSGASISSVNTGSGDGSIRLDVVDNDSVVDASSNPLGGSGAGNGDFSSGESYSIIKSLKYFAAPIAIGAGNCFGWENACTLQTALTNAISGGEIWVKAGLYKPGVAKTDSFTLKNGVAVYGGFAGTETQRIQRDPQTNLTVLSGDIDNNDTTDANGVIISAANIVGSNSNHVVKNGVAVLDGFIITGGQANGVSPDNIGGGYLISGGSPTLANLTFSGNAASHGGALYANLSSLTLSNVIFRGNTAAQQGGAIYFANSSPVLTDVDFIGNATTSSDMGNGGGAILNFQSNTIITNAVFSGNSAVSSGSAVIIWNSNAPTLTNVTMSGNTAQSGGAIFNISSTPTLKNVVVWGNSSGIVSSGSLPTASYSLIQNSGSNFADGGHNMSSDPLFVDADGADNITGTLDDDLRLNANSPAIDAGTNTGCPTTDHAGVLRPQGPTCDLGAYEFDLPTLYAAPAATGSGDCSSWANACTLQTALTNAVSGDEIWVKAGIYKPGAARTDTFQLKNGVKVYGGFNGTEQILIARDPAANITTLSGDIDNNDTVNSNGVVTNTADITGNNSYHVVTGSGRNSTALLDGFTITGGQANGAAPDDKGGGVYNVSGSPTLSNLIIRGNVATFGAGIYNDNSSPALDRIIVMGNSSTTAGGGMFNHASSPTLQNILFTDNSGGGSGGGLKNESGGSPTLINVTISGNTASNGGGVFNDDSSLVVKNSIVWNNPSTSQFLATNTPSLPAISSSLIQGLGTFFFIDQGSNIDATPLFSDANFHLADNSPAVDAGSNTVCPAYDLAGTARPRGLNCDMGTYENIDTTAPTVTSIIRVDSNPTSASALHFTVTFNETVSGVDTADFNLTASGVTSAAVTNVSGLGSTRTITVNRGSGAGTLRLDLTDNDTILDRSGNALGGTGNGNGSFTSGDSYTIILPPTDITLSNNSVAENQPLGTTIGTLSATDPDSGTHTYSLTCSTPGADDASFQISGTALNTNAIFNFEAKSSYNICIRATDSDSLTFDKNFTISITDVDEVSPTVVSITRVNTTPTNAASVSFTVTFSKPVTGVTTSSFSVTKSGASVTDVSGTGATRTVSVATGSGSGTLRLDIPASGTIIDAAGNHLAGMPFNTGESYTVDRTPPTVLSITRLDATPTSKLSVRFLVTFSEAVTNVNAADFTLFGPVGASVTGVSGTGVTRTVTVSTGNGDSSLILRVLGTTATITDTLGNALLASFTSGQSYIVQKTLTILSTGAQDGWTLESTETSGLGGTADSASTTIRIGDDASDRQYRSVLSFNTASLPDNAVITKVTLKLKLQNFFGTNPLNTHGNLLVDVIEGTFSNSVNLQAGDFGAPATQSAVGVISATPLNGYYTKTWVSGILSSINRTNTTQFRLRFTKDDNDDNSADFLAFFSGNSATVGTQPTLIVEYHTQ